VLAENAVELTRRIRKIAPALELIVLTPTGASREYERFRALGVRSFVPKPVNPPELYAAISEMAAAATSPGEASSEWRRSCRILVAEDNVVNQRLAARLLQKIGHDVVVVENGRLAVDSANRQQFDLILMDLQMPEMDGLEATSAIRGSAGLTSPDIPIVAMTAHNMKDHRDLCIDAGIDALVTKPIIAAALRCL